MRASRMFPLFRRYGQAMIKEHYEAPNWPTACRNYHPPGSSIQDLEAADRCAVNSLNVIRSETSKRRRHPFRYRRVRTKSSPGRSSRHGDHTAWNGFYLAGGIQFFLLIRTHSGGLSQRSDQTDEAAGLDILKIDTVLITPRGSLFDLPLLYLELAFDAVGARSPVR